MCDNASLYKNSLAYLADVRADAAIDHICQGFTIVYAHVVFVLEALDLGARHAVRHRIVINIYWVVQPWSVLNCAAYSEHVHLKAQCNKRNYRTALDLVLEVADFFNVHFSCSTFEVEEMH